MFVRDVTAIDVTNNCRTYVYLLGYDLGCDVCGLVLYIGSSVSQETTAFIWVVEINLKKAVVVSSDILVSTVHTWSHIRTPQCEYFLPSEPPISQIYSCLIKQISNGIRLKPTRKI